MNTKRWIAFFLSFMGVVYAQEDSYRLIREINLKHALVSPYANVIKLYDVAVDEVQGLGYVSGMQTEFVSILDLENGCEIGNVTVPFNSTIHELDCNPANGFLYVTKTNISPLKLYAIDPSTSEVKGTYSYATIKTGLAFDVKENLVFLADGSKIKILDGTSLDYRAAISAGMSVGGLAVDSTRALLYAMSRSVIGNKITVKIFDLRAPYAFQKKYDVASSVPLGECILDEDRNRLLLIGQSLIKEVNANTGALIKSITLPTDAKSPVYDDHRQVLYLTDEVGYSQEGEGGSWTKLYRYDFVAGQLDSLRMGDRASNLGIDNRREILFVPSMHSGWVELFHLDSGKIDSVDTGESADEMGFSPDRNNLFIADRLGGSRIIRYDCRDGSLSTFRAGNWPAVVETDSALNKLYVLNVFESSISVIHPSTQQLLNTIHLSIPEARTDAIPFMYYGQLLNKLYLAFPEFNKILVVDLFSEQEEKSFDLPGFCFDEEKHAAIGAIQLCASFKHQRLYILQREEKKLKIFDLRTYNLLDSLDVSSWWPKNSIFEGYLLGYDPLFDRLYLGNRFFDPVTFAPEGTFAGQLFVGYAPDWSKFYSIAEKDGWVSLFEVNRESKATITERKLFQPSGDAAPVFLHNPYTNEFFISEFNYAVLRHYDLDEVSSKVEGNSFQSLPCVFRLDQNYPNPFNSSTVISFRLPFRGHVTLTVFDPLGREVRRLVDGMMEAGNHQILFDARGLASGLYVCRIEAGFFRQNLKALLIK